MAFILIPPFHTNSSALNEDDDDEDDDKVSKDILTDSVKAETLTGRQKMSNSPFFLTITVSTGSIET